MNNKQCFDDLLEKIQQSAPNLLMLPSFQNAIQINDYYHLLAACFALDNDGKPFINKIKEVSHQYVGYMLYKTFEHARVTGQKITLEGIAKEVTEQSMFDLAKTILQKNIPHIDNHYLLELMSDDPNIGHYARWAKNINSQWAVVPIIFDEQKRAVLQSLYDISANERREMYSYCRNALRFLLVTKKNPQLAALVENFSIALAKIMKGEINEETINAYKQAEQLLANKLEDKDFVNVLKKEKQKTSIRMASFPLMMTGMFATMTIPLFLLLPYAPVVVAAIMITALVAYLTISLVSGAVYTMNSASKSEPAVIAEKTLAKGRATFFYAEQAHNTKKGDFVVIEKNSDENGESLEDELSLTREKRHH